MSVSKIAGVILGSAALVAGHGYVSGAVVDGQYYGGFLVDKYSYMDDPPKVIGWSEDAKDLGFVDGSSYSDPDIICHKDAKNAGLSASVKAGGKIELQWTEWPESHHGPVITYLANCNGDCSSVDKTALGFFKIDEAGLINGDSPPGTWASDNLISNNNSYTVTVPSGIAAGNYVLRHEIIALHSAGETNGAQNYPQCLNLKVTGGGSDSPTGTVGTKLYTNTDPGIKIGIYQALSSYTIPGPDLYSGAASSGSATSAPTSSSAIVTPAPSSSAADGSVSPVSSVDSSSLQSPTTAAQVPTFSGAPRPSYTRRPIRSSSPSASIPKHTLTGEPALSQATDGATVTNQPAEQTPNAAPEVSVTASPTGQSAQGSSPVQEENPAPSATSSAVPTSTPVDGSESSSSGSDSDSSSSGSSSGSASESDASSYNSGDWTSYLDSLSAEQFLGLLRQTTKWLVTDKKHARDLTN